MRGEISRMNLCFGSTVNQLEPSLMEMYKRNLVNVCNEKRINYSICNPIDILSSKEKIDTADAFICVIDEKLCYNCRNNIPIIDEFYHAEKTNKKILVICIAQDIPRYLEHEKTFEFVDMLFQKGYEPVIIKMEYEIKSVILEFVEMDGHYPSKLSPYLVSMPSKIAAKPDYFISYARKDWIYIEQILSILKNHNYTYWLDMYIKPGENWLEQISTYIKRCKSMILLLSRYSCESYWVYAEYSSFSATQKPIIPVLYDIDDTAFVLNNEKFSLLATTQITFMDKLNEKLKK